MVEMFWFPREKNALSIYFYVVFPFSPKDCYEAVKWFFMPLLLNFYYVNKKYQRLRLLFCRKLSTLLLISMGLSLSISLKCHLWFPHPGGITYNTDIYPFFYSTCFDFVPTVGRRNIFTFWRVFDRELNFQGQGTRV